MVVFSGNPYTIYANLQIKPPVTLSMFVPRQSLLNSIGAVDGTYIVTAQWEFKPFTCPTDQPQCQNPTGAFSAYITYEASTQTYYWNLYVGPLYVQSGVNPVMSGPIFQKGAEQDITMNVIINGSRLTITVNGQTVFDSDMLVQFPLIVQLVGGTEYLTSSGTVVSGEAPAAFSLDIIPGFDFTGVINTILPLAAVAGIIGFVPKLLSKVSNRNRIG